MITAGGTLGILIPPSVMIIVYAAVAGQSVVKLYASAMFPGFFLSFLYLVYIVGWALINPKIAPTLPESADQGACPRLGAPVAAGLFAQHAGGLVSAVVSPAKALKIEASSVRVSYGMLLKNFTAALVPLVLTAVTLWGVWWYVVIHPQTEAREEKAAGPRCRRPNPGGAGAAAAKTEEKPQELGVEDWIGRYRDE